jgi:hypothetical protein
VQFLIGRDGSAPILLSGSQEFQSPTKSVNAFWMLAVMAFADSIMQR